MVMTATVTRALVLALLAQAALCTIYFQEDFQDGDGWKSRWTESKKKDSQGKLEIGKGELNAGTEAENGLITAEDMRHYTVTAPFDPFTNKDKTLVLQYQAKLPKKFDCGGIYLKLYPKGHDLTTLDGDSKYNIMFGPDHCGYSTKKIHLIFNYNGKNHEKKDEIKIEYNEKDELSHLYTLIVKPDNTYKVLFDNKEKASGSLFDHFDFLEPKEIDDPEDKKPADWVENAKMPDPADKKPEGYDDIPKQIVDPAAKKPDDWDDESDGEWEAPMIDNPDYKGEWKPKMIDNPDYKGVWKAKRIPNPKYKEDNTVVQYESIAAVGIEVWNVNGGTVYDNIIVADDEKEAADFAEKTFTGLQDKEKKVKEDKEKAEKEKADKEAAAKKAEEDAKKKDDDDDDDDDDDEDDKKADKKKDEL